MQHTLQNVCKMQRATWTIQLVAVGVEVEVEAAHTGPVLVHQVNLHLFRSLGIQMQEARPCAGDRDQPIRETLLLGTSGPCQFYLDCRGHRPVLLMHMKRHSLQI